MQRFVFLSLFVFACGPARTEIEMKEVSNSGQNGKALIIELPGEKADDARMEIQLDVSKGVNGLYQYVGLYAGSCAQLGSLMHRVGLARDGVLSSQILSTEYEQLRNEGHALVLRRDSRDDSPLASCGDVR